MFSIEKLSAEFFTSMSAPELQRTLADVVFQSLTTASGECVSYDTLSYGAAFVYLDELLAFVYILTQFPSI